MPVAQQKLALYQMDSHANGGSMSGLSIGISIAAFSPHRWMPM
jgi:hypothetical protein